MPGAWSQHPGTSQGAGHGARARGARVAGGAKAALPHHESSQEIAADSVNPPTCRSLPKSAAGLRGAPLAEPGRASTQQPCNTFGVCNTGCCGSTAQTRVLPFTESHRSSIWALLRANILENIHHLTPS